VFIKRLPDNTILGGATSNPSMQIDRNNTALPLACVHWTMTIQVTAIGDWRETNRGEHSFSSSQLLWRYEEIGVYIAAQLDRIVQAAGDRRAPQKNAIGSPERERVNDFGRGCIDHEGLCSAPRRWIYRRNWADHTIAGVHCR
jgi:hypothetical protein